MSGFTSGKAPPILASHHSVSWGDDYVRVAFGDQHSPGAEVTWHTQIFMTRAAAELFLSTVVSCKAQNEALKATKN